MILKKGFGEKGKKRAEKRLRCRGKNRRIFEKTTSNPKR